jgi:hypothetical protein
VWTAEREQTLLLMIWNVGGEEGRLGVDLVLPVDPGAIPEYPPFEVSLENELNPMPSPPREFQREFAACRRSSLDCTSSGSF